MDTLSGCWREAQRADAVVTKLIYIRTLVGLELYEEISALLKEIETSSRLLRDLFDLFPIYGSRVPVVSYYLTIILPSLQRTMTDMMICIDNEALPPPQQWTTLCRRLNGYGGMTLTERFVLYNEFLIQTVRLLSRSPIYDPTSLELLRMRLLRIRSLQLIPGPPVPVMPHQPSPAGNADVPAAAAQPSASHRSPARPDTADEQHWAENIFCSVPHSATALNHRRYSRCFGPAMVDEALGISPGSTVLFKIPFDRNRLSVTCYQTSVQDSSQARLLCRWIDRLHNPQYSALGIHELAISRRGSSLQFRRWSSIRQNSTIWMALFFKTFEKMVLFHCTFVALKNRSSLTLALHPDEYQISGENMLFAGKIIDDGFEHRLVVYQEKRTKVLRLHTEVYQGELKRCPIWTAFVTHQSASSEWLLRRSKHRIYLNDIQPYVFCDTYKTKRQRRKSGQFEVYFANESAADAFEELFNQNHEISSASEKSFGEDEKPVSKVIVQSGAARRTKDDERTGPRRDGRDVEEDEVKVDVDEWQRNIKSSSRAEDFGISGMLYESSISAFVAVYRILQSNTDTSREQVIQDLREEFRKFYVWNDALGTQTGQLERVLETSRNLNTAVLSLLAQWARVLCKLPHVRPDCDWAPVRLELSELEVLVARVDEVVASLSRDEPFNKEVDSILARSRDSSGDSDSASLESIRSMEDIVEDLKVCTECLADLIPSLEHPARDQLTTEKTFHSIMEDLSSVSLVARPFVQAIKEKYPRANTTLAIRVGEAIWRRRVRLRPSISANVNVPRNMPKHEDTQSTIAESSLAPSSRGRYSQTTKSSFVASSIFDAESDPEPEPDPPQRPGIQRRRAPDSVTSARTSIITDAPKSGQRRVPQLPTEGKYGASFRCPICKLLLRDIFNREQWKKHVFDDLEPYICTFGACSENTTTFKSRRDWGSHESSAHADTIKLRTDAGKCTICSINIRQPEKYLGRHICRHLREFSLASLPPLDEDDEEEERHMSDVPEEEQGGESEVESEASSRESVSSWLESTT